MSSFIREILKLQESDGKICLSESKLSQIKKDKQLSLSNLEQEKELDKKEKDDLKKLDLDVKSKEKDLESLEEDLSIQNSKQSSVKNEAAYDALNKTICYLKEQISKKEEDILVALEEFDKIKAKTDKNTLAHKDNISRLEKNISSLEQQAVDIEKDILNNKREFGELKTVLSDNVVQLYSRLKASGLKFPFAVEAKNGYCSGCFLKISTEISDQIKENKTPSYCENCGKLLFLEDQQ